MYNNHSWNPKTVAVVDRYYVPKDIFMLGKRDSKIMVAVYTGGRYSEIGRQLRLDCNRSSIPANTNRSHLIGSVLTEIQS